MTKKVNPPDLNQFRPQVLFEYGSGGGIGIVRVLSSVNGGMPVKDSTYDEKRPSQLLTTDTAVKFIHRWSKMYPHAVVDAIGTSIMRRQNPNVNLERVKAETGVIFRAASSAQEFSWCGIAAQYHLHELCIGVHFGGESTEMGIWHKNGKSILSDGFGGDCRTRDDCINVLNDGIQRTDPTGKRRILTVTGNVFCELGFLFNGNKSVKPQVMLPANQLWSELKTYKDVLPAGKKRSAAEMQFAANVLFGWLCAMPKIDALVISRASSREGRYYEMVAEERRRVMNEIRNGHQLRQGGPT